MFTARFVDGPRKGEQDTILGRDPVEGELAYYMRFGVQGWVRVLESWESEPGCVIYELKFDDTDPNVGPGDDAGTAHYTFVREIGVAQSG